MICKKLRIKELMEKTILFKFKHFFFIIERLNLNFVKQSYSELLNKDQIIKNIEFRNENKDLLKIPRRF